MNVQSISDTNFEARKQVKAPQIEKLSTEVLSQLPTELSLESKKLVKKAHNLIEDTWVRIRKKEVDMLTPTFIRNISQKQITLSPLYHGNNRSIVLQIDNAKGYQRITVDRFAENFTYEKVVKTEFGSATTASYNSRTSKKNESYTSIVNELLEDYLPKFVKQPPNPNL